MGLLTRRHYGVYILENKSDRKRLVTLIGFDTDKPPDPREQLMLHTYHNNAVSHLLKKNGKESFKYELSDLTDDKKIALKMKRELIQFLGSNNPRIGYNSPRLARAPGSPPMPYGPRVSRDKRRSKPKFGEKWGPTAKSIQISKDRERAWKMVTPPGEDEDEE